MNFISGSLVKLKKKIKKALKENCYYFTCIHGGSDWLLISFSSTIIIPVWR